MKRIISLLLLLVSTTAFSQEKLSKIIYQILINDTLTTQHQRQFYYDPQDRIYKVHSTSYNVTGTLTASGYTRYVFNNNGQLDSIIQTQYNLQNGQIGNVLQYKYYYTGILLDSIYWTYNNFTEPLYKHAKSYHYNNGLEINNYEWVYYVDYGWVIANKYQSYYDINNNKTGYDSWHGSIVNNAYSMDSVPYKDFYFYSNLSRPDSMLHSVPIYSEQNNTWSYIDTQHEHYTYLNGDSIKRKTSFYYSINDSIWYPPIVDNFYYDNANLLLENETFSLTDSILGNNLMTDLYVRNNAGRLDTIKYCHENNNVVVDCFGRDIYIYSSNPDDLNSIPAKIAVNTAVYPNPFINFITIETDNTDKKSILVFTMDGKLISNYVTTDKKHIYNAGHLAPGMYIVSVTTANGTVTRMVTKGN